MVRPPAVMADGLITQRRILLDLRGQGAKVRWAKDGPAKRSRWKRGRNMEQTLRVGVISSMHGVHGEVKVFPTTDDAKRFKKLKEVLLDTGKELKPMEIEHVKFFKNMVIVKFKGFDNINDMEIYKGKDLLITRENAVELGPDENFIVDLIGLSVVTDEGEVLGKLTDVIQTGANDVYEVKMENGKTVLLPAIKPCILDVNLEAQKMTVHVLDGLLDL